VTFSLGARGGDDGERGEGDHKRVDEEVRGRGIQPGGYKEMSSIFADQ
jgi:hypothetical protein